MDMDILSFTIGSLAAGGVFSGSTAVYFNRKALKNVFFGKKNKVLSLNLNSTKFYIDKNDKKFEIDNESFNILVHCLKSSHYSHQVISTELNKNINSSTVDDVKKFVTKFNEKRGGSYNRNYYISIQEKADKIMKGFIKVGDMVFMPRLSYEDFFGIPVVIGKSSKDEMNKHPIKITEKNKEIWNCTSFSAFVTDIDFTQHKFEYSQLCSIKSKIKEIKSELKEYKDSGGTDEEVIKTAENAIREGFEQGKLIVDELKEIYELKQFENINEKGLALFNKSMNMLS